MKKIGALMVLVLLVLPVQAQETQYRLLPTPAADTYFQAIITFHGDLPENYDRIFAAVNRILFTLYPDPLAVSFDTYRRAYDTLQISQYDFQLRGEWLRRMLATWLHENDVDLSTITRTQVGDIYIVVTPHDFDGDGQNEYVLDTMKGQYVSRDQCLDDTEVAAFFLAVPTADGYRLLDTGLDWKGRYYTIGNRVSSDGGMAEALFDDLTGDGLPEWVLLEGGEADGNGDFGFGDLGALHILGWREGRLKQLGQVRYFAERTYCDNGPYSPTISWDFTDTDSDGTKEIYLHEQQRDNWGCSWVSTDPYVWDPAEDQYIYQRDAVDKLYNEDTAGCQQRYAEEAMWTGDYAGALQHYRQALSLITTPPEVTIYTQNSSEIVLSYAYTRYQYLRMRTALAYLLTGQPDQAEPLLTALAAEEFYDAELQTYAELLRQLYDSEAPPLQICIETFRLMAEYPPRNRWDITDEDWGLDRILNDSYFPENASCDAPPLVREAVQDLSIPVDANLDSVLGELGIGIQYRLPMDLNRDGRIEWLLWLDVPGVQIFLAPAGETYNIDTDSQVDPFREADDIQTKALPNDSGDALVLFKRDLFEFARIPPWRRAYGWGGGIYTECSEDREYPITATSIFRLNDSRLLNIFEGPMCNDSMELPGILPETITNSYLDYDAIEPEIQTYTWDSATQRYAWLPPTPAPPQPTDTPEPVLSEYLSSYDAFAAGAFADVLLLTRDTFQIDDGRLIDFYLNGYFMRALSLQALGRDDEALALFVAIYNAAPDHIWGVLARLHFEPY